ncbi:malonyl-ACP O-methyltransferase BioC [Chitinibacter bivalviorum]|uniref:Malonyl-[acyl-carrier protein] O-methyltransferase n=1 Tax=Chitinibacter bivalviorum TaxID=2739434 RepID=A0A7H9BFP5_9NEIS|nr:malonyl-ACP O-methyltransferase BioC [Chitinibacter bivalviorum]QLG87407.1 malonyl-ACP O-methyltransferase BioC [Chitinibacter bivalviorum]
MSEQFHTLKTAIRTSFENAAHSYDAAAVLQREIIDRMFERLSLIRVTPQRVLDAGSGTGYAVPKLQARFPQAQIIELDLAHTMLQVSRAKQAGFGLKKLLRTLSNQQPAQVCSDIEQLPFADNSLDVIWSSLTLQWCNTPDAAFAEFQRVLKPGGLLMFATLGPDTLKELRTAFAGVDGYEHVNRFIDMHDLGDSLVQHGFATPVMDMEYLTLTYEDTKSVMQDLKGIGAHNNMQGRRAGMFGKRAWLQVQAQYEALRSNGKLPCTYEVVYGHAWKSEGKKNTPRADGSQIIEFRPRAKP